MMNVKQVPHRKSKSRTTPQIKDKDHTRNQRQRPHHKSKTRFTPQIKNKDHTTNQRQGPHHKSKTRTTPQIKDPTLKPKTQWEQQQTMKYKNRITTFELTTQGFS